MTQAKQRTIYPRQSFTITVTANFQHGDGRDEPPTGIRLQFETFGKESFDSVFNATLNLSFGEAERLANRLLACCGK